MKQTSTHEHNQYKSQPSINHSLSRFQTIPCIDSFDNICEKIHQPKNQIFGNTGLTSVCILCDTGFIRMFRIKFFGRLSLLSIFSNNSHNFCVAFAYSPPMNIASSCLLFSIDCVSVLYKWSITRLCSSAAFFFCFTPNIW